jgi:hypothetical protein
MSPQTVMIRRDHLELVVDYLAALRALLARVSLDEDLIEELRAEPVSHNHVLEPLRYGPATGPGFVSANAADLQRHLADTLTIAHLDDFEEGES